jgi:hypothetical protein
MTQCIKHIEWFSNAQCDENPKYLYVFGDNLISSGCGGQAIIRYKSNSFGIPTKRLPSMKANAFFSDQQDEINAVLDKLDELYTILLSNKYDFIIFPADGLGTGLAKMKQFSPIIFNLMNTYILLNFNIDLS